MKSDDLKKAISDLSYFPLMTSQTMTVWSNDPVINCDPDELKEREIISAEWPWNETLTNESPSL